MEMRRMAILNLCMEVKRIVEVDLGRSDFTFLLEQPDDDKEIVFPTDYIAGTNFKMPVIVVDIDQVTSEAFEMGGSSWDIGECIIDVICQTKPESMDVCEYILKKLLGEHDFYDFSEGDVPDYNAPFDPGSLPSTVLTKWQAVAEEDFTQTTLKLTRYTEPNYAKRYTSSLEGTIRYLRDFS